MTHDPRYTKTTPLNPDQVWPNRHTDPQRGLTEPFIGPAFAELQQATSDSASQPSDPATHTDPPTPPTTGDSGHTDAPARIVYSDDLAAIEEVAETFDRAAELAETCAVLTELAQQLTNALGIQAMYRPPTAELQAALDAAAELGITPKDQP